MSCPVSAGYDPLAPAFLADPFPHLAELRTQAPVFHHPELDMWVVTRHADIERIMKDHRTFSGANTQEPVFPLNEEARALLADGFGTSPTMSNGPEPKHSRVRSHCLKVFSARRLEVLAPTVRARADELITRMLTRPRFDAVNELTYPLPASVVFALIGFPAEDTVMLKELAAERMVFTWGRATPEQQTDVAKFMVRYWKYCVDFVHRRLAEPRDDFTSDLVRVHLADPEALTVDEITNVIHAISFAGHETTTNVATSALLRLLSDRAQWEALCADPSLVPQAVEEALRYDPSLFTWRRKTTRAVDIGGVTVPEGAKLLLQIGSANHDPQAFDDPEAFDIRREAARHHLTFGRGIHYCFGAPLARMEIGTMLELLTRRAPDLRLAGEPVDYPKNICFRGPTELWLEHDA
ncbi:cytochrome P450 [Streptomyces sp. BBFR2]|uniref:cytochrome P450 n=1 Tax=Streptomyces sp. BBFR2 TaxID=3372854 RepID=UPI0037DA2561